MSTLPKKKCHRKSKNSDIENMDKIILISLPSHCPITHPDCGRSAEYPCVPSANRQKWQGGKRHTAEQNPHIRHRKLDWWGDFNLIIRIILNNKMLKKVIKTNQLWSRGSY